jgi:hypothetical protein
MSRFDSQVALAAMVGIGWLAVTARAASGQATWSRADSLRVSVSVDSAALTASETLLWLSVEVAADSHQPLWRLVFERRAPVSQVSGPEKFRAMDQVAQDRPAVFWAGAGGRVRPGERKAGFFFRGTGLPTVVSFWAQGYYPPLRATPENEESLPPEPSVYENSFRGLAVGLESPSDASPPGLVARALDLLRSACGMGWITSDGVCHSLQVKLDAAGRSLGGGDAQSAKGQLTAFLNELGAQRGAEPGKHVTDNAYWLLSVNARFLLASL